MNRSRKYYQSRANGMAVTFDWVAANILLSYSYYSILNFLIQGLNKEKDPFESFSHPYPNTNHFRD